MQKGARKQLLFFFPLDSFLLALSSRFPLSSRNTPKHLPSRPTNKVAQNNTRNWSKQWLKPRETGWNADQKKTFASCSRARF
uniref:Putative secreted protein n=1 Tax=Ixodes ricinus TaxID=34613 RepID=A0A6B0TYX8_IXORI